MARSAARRFRVIRTLLTVLAFLPVAAAVMPGAGPAAAQDATEGAALFARHCAMCHGTEARGNGPEAPTLNPQPSDLTTLSARNGGVFPLMRVLRRIDGREAIVAHGSPMPVFGGFFEGPPALATAEGGEAVETTRPVADIVAWLEAVQEK